MSEEATPSVRQASHLGFDWETNRGCNLIVAKACDPS